MFRSQKPVSDTITVTPDGRTIVDVQKLLAKEHVKKTMKAMREAKLASDPSRKK